MSEHTDTNQIEMGDTTTQVDPFNQNDQTNTSNDSNQIKPITMKDVLAPLLETISPLALCAIYLIFIVLCCFALGMATLANPMYKSTAIGTWGCDRNNYTEFTVGNCTGVDLMKDANTKMGEVGTYKIGPFSKLNRAFNVDGYFKNVMKRGFCLFLFLYFFISLFSYLLIINY